MKKGAGTIVPTPLLSSDRQGLRTALLQRRRELALRRLPFTLDLGRHDPEIGGAMRDAVLAVDRGGLVGGPFADQKFENFAKFQFFGPNPRKNHKKNGKNGKN